MKLISFNNLIAGMTKTFFRFPAAILTAITGTFTAIYLTEANLNIDEQQFYSRILFTSILGLSLYISVSLLTEKKNIQSKILAHITGTIFLALFFFLQPEKIQLLHLYKLIVFLIVTHCFVSFAPFTGNGNTNGFWQFNKSLFLHFLISTLYSFVLFTGIALAMLTTENLFDISIDENRYFQLWIIIVGIFNTWFFLSGIPSDILRLEKEKKYPKGLKIFTQWVLLPLVSLYLIILYLYFAKIIITTVWPSGWVANLVLCFSITGIFSLLLVYPVKNVENNLWIRVFTRIFYWALIPLIVLLFIAIFKRIYEYGLTENRYYVILLALWLSAMTIYQIIKRFNNIKIIPVSLGIMFLLSSFGPWGAFQISKNSQLNRLTSLLEKNNILINNKIINKNHNVSFEDKKQISSTVEYLIEMHGYKILKPFFSENLDSLLADTLYVHKPTEILGLMGIDYVERWETNDNYNNNFYFSTKDYNNQVVKINGYDYMIEYNKYFYTYENNDNIYVSSYKLDSSVFTIKYDTLTYSMIFTIDNLVQSKINIKKLINNLHESYNENTYDLEPGDMTQTVENKDIKISLTPFRIGGTLKDEKLELTEISSRIFVKIK